MDIIVDPRFRDKIPKPSAEEYRQLEENILSDGFIREPLVVWKGHNILIDGHNRWAIYQAHSEDIPAPSIWEMEFSDEYAAEDWMLMNQLGRRNLNEMQITALRGQLYKARKKSVGGQSGNANAEKRMGQNEPIVSNGVSTAEQLAKQLGIGPSTVKRAELFVDGLEAAEAVVPGFKDEILSGNTPAKKSEIADMSKLKEPEQIAAAVEKIRNPQRVTFPVNQKAFGRTLDKTDPDIERTVARKTDKSALVEYDIEDLLEDLRMLQEDFIDKYHRAIDLHMDVATDNGRKVLACMKEFDGEWKELKEKFH